MKAPKKNLITAALLAAPAFASALGLGGINVKSGLNQPLLAEIPVTVASPAERDSLLVMLANSDDYARVGIDARGLNVPLEFAVAKDARGETIIRVTSKEAIREPFLQLLLQVNWNKGKLLREYSLLIDPPVMAPALRGSQAVSAPVKEAAPALPVEQMVKPAEPTSTPKPATPVASTPTPQAKPAAPAPKPAPAAVTTEAPAAPGSVTTKSGDSAYVIANANKPAGTSTDQMMVAILRMNPQAFYQDNINALKTGQILRMPSADDLKQTSIAEASQQVREQNALWRSMQANASQQPVVVADSGASTAGSSTSTSSSAPRLELLPPKSEDNGKALSAANAEASRAREELLSREREVSELRARVSELEKIKTDQERVVSFKDDQLAELTKQLELARKQAATPPKVETTPAPSVPEPVTTTEPVAQTPVVAAEETTTDNTAATDASSAPDDIWGESDTTTSNADGTTSTEPSANTSAADSSTDAAADPSAEPSTETASTLEPDPNAAPADGTTVAPVAEPSVSEPVSTDTAAAAPAVEEKPWYMNPIAWGVGGVGLLGALALLLRKKKPAPRREMAAPSFAEDMNFGVPAAVGAGGAAIGMGYAERDEDEARIQGAIAANPNDLWAHLDLLRLYYSRQDHVNFESAASTMFGFVVDQNSPQWQEAKTMGMQIIPGSPLFASIPDFGSMDDAPAFDSSQYDVPAPAAPKHDDSLGSLDLGAFEDDQPAAPVAPRGSDFGFDLDIDGPTKVMQPLQGDAVVAPPKPVVAPVKDEFNFDFNFDAPSVPAPKLETTRSVDIAPSAVPTLDVGNIALDDVVPAPLENFGEISGDEFMIGDDAVATKLDLARAYLDMGDPDGARSMLEEVLGEGTDAQRNEAKQLLGRIA